MRHSKFNRYERKQQQQEKLARSLAGSGLFVYRNPSKTGTITLPKPTASGRRTVGPGEEFQGDSYFMTLVQIGDLMKVRTLITPEQEKAEAAAKAAVAANLLAAPKVEDVLTKAEEVLAESTKQDNKPRQNQRKESMHNPKAKKLIVDQPDRVTVEGKVEQVVREDGVRQLNDHDNKRQPDVLLNENPVGEIIIE